MALDSLRSTAVYFDPRDVQINLCAVGVHRKRVENVGENTNTFVSTSFIYLLDFSRPVLFFRLLRAPSQKGLTKIDSRTAYLNRFDTAT